MESSPEGSPIHKHKFHTLDALRGISAIIVVILHAPLLFKWRPHHGWLAVDMFFMLSGFVLSHAYQQRLDRQDAPWSTWAFLMGRIIRLAPLFVLSLIFSFAVTVTINPLHYQNPAFSSPFWLSALLANLFLIPVHSAHHLGIGIYPFNSVYWSLFLEIVANVLHGLFLRRTKTKTLSWLTGGAAFALTTFVVIHRNQDSGTEWGSLLTGGMLRLAFSYLAGMLLYRVWQRGFSEHALWTRWLSFNPFIVLGITAIVLSTPTPHEAITGLMMTLLLFPALILAGALSQPKKGLVSSFQSLGLTSYSLYLNHLPLIAVFCYVLPDAVNHPQWAGYVTLSALLGLMSIVDNVYDKPVRAALVKRTT